MNLSDHLPSAAAMRRLIPLLIVMAAVLLLFRDTALAMVGIWNRSDTFAHAFLVPPIVVWLAWRRRAHLAQVPTRAAPWVLLPMAAVCLLWLLGELAGVNAATQFAVVALLVLSVPLVFGMAMARALTFPLLFLFFAVPVGEFMVPVMMEWTADFAATAVRLSGVPLYREGLQFVIPTGSWSVVEACSGVRYLIASFMVGTLFAYLNFQTPWRRALFMLVSLLVPIVANWLRAYLIVMIGHLSDNKLAAGVDHIIYGWVFFGLVIGVMFMIGSRWAEPEPGAPVLGASTASPVSGPLIPGEARALWVCVPAIALLVMVQAAMFGFNHAHSGDGPPRLSLADTLEGGWKAVDEPLSRWEPHYLTAVANQSRTYQRGDVKVGLWLAFYRDQNYDRKLVTSTNGLVDGESDGEWAQTSRGSAETTLLDRKLTLRAAALRGSREVSDASAQRLKVWHAYWIAGRFVTSDVLGRLLVAFARLFGQGDDSAAVFLYAPFTSGDERSGPAADAALAAFAPAALLEASKAMERVRAAR